MKVSCGGQVVLGEGCFFGGGDIVNQGQDRVLGATHEGSGFVLDALGVGEELVL